MQKAERKIIKQKITRENKRKKMISFVKHTKKLI